MEDEIPPISEPVEEALVKIMRPDLLGLYHAEKERHRQEMKEIETAMKRARQMVKKLFGKLRVTKGEELEAEYLERTQGEVDRHAKAIQEIRETIRDHVDPSRHDGESV